MAESFTVDHLIRMQRPFDVQVSPDGAVIAYVLKPISREGEHWRSAIWLVPFSGGEPRQFTSGLWHDSEPRWSPDGSYLAFLSDRIERGKTSLYLISRDGGEAMQLISQSGDMSELCWSPDGRYLSFLFVESETEEERKRRERGEDARVWDTDYRYRRLWLVEVATREARVASPAGLQVWGYAWAPDSQRIALAVSLSPKVDDLFRETSVGELRIDTGTYRDLFRVRGLAENLVWSADGEWLAYRGPAGRVVHGEYVFRRHVETGVVECLTPDYGGTVEWLGASRGGEELVIVAYEGLDARVFRLGWEGERALWCPRVGGTWHGGVSGSRDGRIWAGVWSDVEHVPNVWGWDTGSEYDISHLHSQAQPQLHQLTTLHPEIQANLCPAQVVEWESEPGVIVQGLLLTPHNYDGTHPLPLVVQIHGGPTSQWTNEFLASWHDWAQPLAQLGCAVLLPNPRGSTGRGTAWINALFGEVGAGEYRDVLSGVKALISRGIADPNRLAVCGWSWGGYLTAWTITQTNQFRAALMGAGPCNLISDNNLGDIPSANLSYFEHSPSEDPDTYWSHSPIRYVQAVQTPLLIIHGEEDERVSVSESIQFYHALKLLDKPCTLVTYPREKHAIEEQAHQRDLLNRILAWFSKYLDLPNRNYAEEQSEDLKQTLPHPASSH